MLKRSIMFCCGALLGVALLTIGVRAESIDGTTGVAFQQYNHVFRDGDQAQGFVYFADGFTVLPGAAITMDCVTSVSGAIDLRGTGAVHLARDLALDSHVTISDGGYFSSAGKGLTLGGNLRIPSGKVVHCAGDMVIDGGGRTLTFEPHAQLMVDANATVTLRNMIISTDRIAVSKTQLDCSGSSKLCFDNVIFSLGYDLDLKGGQHFFHHDVVVTGSNALRYRSTKPAYIASQSSLYVQDGSTFLYAPYANDSGFVKLADASSRLIVDNASLDVVGQGLRLTRGQLGLNNTVDVNVTSAIATPVVGDRTDTSYSLIRANVWSPNGAWLAIGLGSPYFLNVFKASDLTTSVFSAAMGGFFMNSFTNDGVNLIAWTPDSDCFVFPSGSNLISVYRIDSLGNCSLVEAKNVGDSIYSLAFSPDGKWLAVGGDANFYIYPVNENKTLGTVVTHSGVSQVFALAWSPNGRCLALSWGSVDDYRLKVGTVDVSGNWTLTQALGKSGNFPPTSITWSPDGTYLAATYSMISTTDALYIYYMNQEDGTFGARVTGSMPQYAHSLSWSVDSRYLLVGRSSQSYNNFLVYRIWNGQATIVQTVSTDGNPYKLVAWHPAGEKIAAYKSNYYLCTFPVTYNYITSGAPAAALTLGNGGTDATQDCDVRYSAATTLHVSGSVVVDPAHS